MATVIFWLVIAAAVIVIDICTSSFLFVWFSLGSLAAIVAYLLGANLTIQFLVFAVVSLISIAIGYPIVKKKYKESVTQIPLMEETYIGKVFEATEEIKETGRIKVSGIYWAAVNKENTIKVGQKFQITGIDGNKLIIKGLGEE